MTVRLLIVDDHPLVVSGLEGALSAAGDLQVRAVAGSCVEARRALEFDRFDVALVDVRLPDGSGWNLLPSR